MRDEDYIAMAEKSESLRKKEEQREKYGDKRPIIILGTFVFIATLIGIIFFS